MKGKVTLYIWRSSSIARIAGIYINGKDGRIGHVSLRTHHGGESNTGIYASFWPIGNENKLAGSARVYKIGVQGALVPDLKTDKELEGCDPDAEIELNNLDVDTINEAFFKFKNSANNWSIWGSTCFRNKNTQNCAGFVKHLLEIGGAREYFQNQQPKFREMIIESGRVFGYILIASPFLILGKIISGVENINLYPSEPRHFENNFRIGVSIIVIILFLNAIKKVVKIGHEKCFISTSKYKFFDNSTKVLALSAAMAANILQDPQMFQSKTKREIIPPTESEKKIVLQTKSESEREHILQNIGEAITDKFSDNLANRAINAVNILKEAVVTPNDIETLATKLKELETSSNKSHHYVKQSTSFSFR